MPCFSRVFLCAETALLMNLQEIGNHGVGVAFEGANLIARGDDVSGDGTAGVNRTRKRPDASLISDRIACDFACSLADAAGLQDQDLPFASSWGLSGPSPARPFSALPSSGASWSSNSRSTSRSSAAVPR